MRENPKDILDQLSNAAPVLPAGPRVKGYATLELEELIHVLLQTEQDAISVDIKRNINNEIEIFTNDKIYNITQLLQHRPDFAQISLLTDEEQKLLTDEFFTKPH